ncbi:uncharacterized protein LOC129596198 isoform X1 [Paramacrobiotus metropolitanus]|uniref:uncharacterized protein LOC129596198 isoform X1 n=1 Tax=Paramacrobiotus metropolitanus TaxID=2943436 RepID=UPI0024459775|nr:uncharacterized protein LOC129596198 isoform X1 [Paramacrobiotus metropolitanus]
MAASIKKNGLYSPKLITFGLFVGLCGLSLAILDLVTSLHIRRMEPLGVHINANGLAIRIVTAVLYVAAGASAVYTGCPILVGEQAENRRPMLKIVFGLSMLAGLASVVVMLLTNTLDCVTRGCNFGLYYITAWDFCEEHLPECVDLSSLITPLKVAHMCIGLVALLTAVSGCICAYIYVKNPNKNIADEKGFSRAKQNFRISDILKKAMEKAGNIVAPDDEKRPMIFTASNGKY